ncbi:Peptidase, M23/M37 family [hydrothermal vent metagenome]|uniref:Peptidase, M23/M37 family n=1 Tax=hydrothermal vent metagenome TaxID=652676 RepID=A0A1W1D258_9ZZZZ
MIHRYKTLVYSAIKPYSSLLFLDNKYAGMILLATTFINPSVAISGLAAVFFAILFAEYLDFQEEYLAQGFYIYNSLLVGMGIGFIFSPSLISIVLIAILSSFTFMLSFMLNRLFSIYKIPILSLPFSIVTMFLYLASLKYSGLLSTLMNHATMFDIELPLIISSFFKSFGTIFFLPSNIAGLIMFVLVLFFSRIIAIMALSGFYFGVMIHSFLLDSSYQALHDPYAFNYILVAIALCGIFLLPTLKNFILALAGVTMSVVLTDAISTLFNYYSIPVFTLPFNITVIVFIFMLSLMYYKEFNINIKASPEESLTNYLSKIFRFGDFGVKIAPPFSGTWNVYQAFDGKWTHKGKFKYAYDFVKKQNGLTYKNEGLFLEDYYAFGESVLAPVNGYIVDIRSDLVDNPIGEVDRVNNWGNYIIIKSDLGFYVEISHLMQYSCSVQIGEYVTINKIIAKCGNSGYSPEPHIHIQVQDVGVIGGFTRKFSFSQYLQDEKLYFNALPKKEEDITAVVNDKSISSRFLFILDDVFVYDVYEDNKKIKQIKFQVEMNELGEFYLCDEEENKLYFYNNTTEFYFYNYEGKSSYLQWFFITAPRLPFISTQEVVYDDYLPIYLLKTKIQQIFIELASTIKKDFYKIHSQYTLKESIISSQYGKAFLAPMQKGYVKIEYKNISLRKVS